MKKGEEMTSNRHGFKPTKAELNAWLDRQILCTISTLGQDGFPNAATVAFSQDMSLRFFIITDESSRKASNIRQDNRVALTVTNEKDRYTVQLEGLAQELTWSSFKDQEAYHYKKLPFSLPFKDIPGQTPFCIIPVHIRFTDVGVKPWEKTDYDISDS